MKIKVITLFSGYDSQCLALDRLKERHPDFDYDLLAWSEIDKYAIQAHNLLYPQWADRNLGDVSKIEWEKYPEFKDCDLLTYSFPCGLAGTKVKTYGGYRNIEEMQVGDKVLTHNNRYREVVRTMARNAYSYFDIKATGCRLKLTGNHPLWVLRDDEEQWVKVKDLKKTDMISYCIPNINEDTELSDNMLWMLGRYAADGWVNPKLYHSVCFGIATLKAEEFEKHFPKEIEADWKRSMKSCWEYRVADDLFQKLCLTIGNGSKKKSIPTWILNLPKDRLKVFLAGYFAGDGHLRQRSGTDVQMFSTVSKDLFLGIQMCLLKCYNKVCSLSIREDKRKESFNDSYNGQISFSEKTPQIVRGFRVYVPIKSIEEIKGSVQVFNLEVEEDNSYTCDNVNTHNCTDISAAGLQKGFDRDSGTRSGLLWECEKAIKHLRPKYLMMENVKALVSKKFMPMFQEWINLVDDEYHYKSYWQVLNATSFGIPQNRERVFMISVREDIMRGYDFPEPFELTKTLDDVLEEEVDERFYLKNDRIEGLLTSTIEQMKKKDGYKFKAKRR